MKNTITYVAMDTHKKNHKVALHYPGNEQAVQFVVKNTAREIKKMVNKIKKQASADIKFCYEAGVCGFTLKRRIEALGCQCTVIAPSLTPIKPGDHIKTDRTGKLKKDTSPATKVSHSSWLCLYKRQSLDTKTYYLAEKP